jgi:hypothetical protein
MSKIDLRTLLELVGPLGDSESTESASARLRAYLRGSVCAVSELREYVETALSTTGEQYNWALQDLVNHAGQLLGFDVQFGRYRGVAGQIGFDGLWRSPTGRAIVVEVKTTDAYTVRTSTLLGYINDLVSEGLITNRREALGLYVYGRFDREASQLENAIIAEGRQEQLRVTSVDALLNLVDLTQEYELEHETALQLLLPPPVRVDRIVNLVFDIASQERRERSYEPGPVVEPETIKESEDVSYYLLPASDSEDGTPVLENLHIWLDRGLWGLGQRTGYRKSFEQGDRLCFYAARIGVVAEARAASASFELSKDESPKPDLDVPYGLHLTDVRWFEDDPVALTRDLRAQLSAFEGRDLDKGWAWFVQGTSKVTARDFERMTQTSKGALDQMSS